MFPQLPKLLELKQDPVNEFASFTAMSDRCNTPDAETGLRAHRNRFGLVNRPSGRLLCQRRRNLLDARHEEHEDPVGLVSGKQHGIYKLVEPTSKLTSRCHRSPGRIPHRADFCRDVVIGKAGVHAINALAHGISSCLRTAGCNQARRTAMAAQLSGVGAYGTRTGDRFSDGSSAAANV